MKILIPFALVLLSGCQSVETLGPYELAPASNPPRVTVQPVNLQAVYGASDCGGSVTNGACRESTSHDGRVAANAPRPAGN